MQTSPPSPLLGRLAFLAACVGTVLGPLHALARFATSDGSGDLDSPLVRWWAVPAARHGSAGCSTGAARTPST